MKIKVNFLVRN